MRLALLAFTQLIVTIDYNIVYVALPDIGKALGFSAQSLQWVVSAYAVGVGGALLLGGRLVDRIGPRRMFMLGLALYGVSSLVGGLAQNAGMLVAARAVQGIGGALLTPATLTLIFIGFAAGHERNRALGAWGAAGSAGLAAGSLLGGVLTDYLGWRAVLFVNVPLALIAAASAPAVLPADPPIKTEGREFDLLGAIIATAGFSMLVFGLVVGPEDGWTSWQGGGALLVGVVLLALLVAVERGKADPLMPMRMFSNRILVITMITMILFQATLGGGYYLFTTELQEVLRYSPLMAGLAFLPMTLVAMVASLRATPKLIAKFGVRVVLFGSMGVTAIGLAAIAVAISTHSSFWALLPGNIIWGFGGGVAFPSLFVSVSTAGFPPQEQGVASAIASTARQIGGAIGLAGIVAVANAGIAVTHPSVGELAHGLQVACWVAAIVSLVGGITALALKKRVIAPAAPATATQSEGDLVAG